MELTRRSFGKLLIASLVALATGMLNAAGSSRPARFIRAATTRAFPGKVKPVDDMEIRRHGWWLG
jgi:hypothetical protein